jgi:hypothetical protein
LQKPLAISLLALTFVLVMTLSVLYWNYYETVSRRSTKKQSVILDHWGKGSSSRCLSYQKLQILVYIYL